MEVFTLNCAEQNAANVMTWRQPKTKLVVSVTPHIVLSLFLLQFLHYDLNKYTLLFFLFSLW